MKAIYKITNKLNNKSYIGQSNNPMERWKQHKWRALQAIDKGKSAIHDALREVGIDSDKFEEMAEEAVRTSGVSTRAYFPLDKDDIVKIFEMCK